jgi:hypothetical protein
VTPDGKAPTSKEPQNVTQDRHRSPDGRPGTLDSGARLCPPVPDRPRPSTGAHRRGLPGTELARDVIRRCSR